MSIREVIGDSMCEVSAEVIIANPLGMHLRPAQMVVKTVLKYRCDVYLQKGGYRVNAKSIMGLLTLAASRGSRLVIQCKGEGAEKALEAVRNLIEKGFEEL